MVYLVIASLLWSFSFGLIKDQLTGLNPYLVSLIRLALSFLVFLPFLRRVGQHLSLKLMGIGMVQFGLMYCLYIYSYRYLEGHQIALLTVTTPLFVVAIDAFLERRWRVRYWLAAITAVLAALVLVMDGLADLPGLKGILLIQGANLCFALGQVLYKNLGSSIQKDRAVFAWLYLGGLIIPLFFIAVQSQGIAWPTRTGQWLSLLYLGLVPSGLGFYLWNKGVTRVNTGAAGAMNNLKVPFGVLIAWLIFGEVVDPVGMITAAGLMAVALATARGSFPDSQAGRTAMARNTAK